MPHVRQVVSAAQLPITLHELQSAGATNISHTETADGMFEVTAVVPDGPGRAPLRRGVSSLRFGGGFNNDSPEPDSP